MTMLLLIALPLLAALLCLLPHLHRSHVLHGCMVLTGAVMILSFVLVRTVFLSGPLMLGPVLRGDALSVLNAALCSTIFFFASVYALGYFAEEARRGHFTDAHARRFGALWCAFLGTLMLTFFSGNLGLMWVALEATTLASAFLIYGQGESKAVEAMWKYLLVCSVGIALALLGTMLTAAAARDLTHGSLAWAELLAVAPQLDGRIMLAAFIFILVGFGTKAGLAPMHTWLPDAHSQAPSPVSAVFSAVMLNSALYAVLRYLPIAEASLGYSGRAKAMLVLFGVSSVVVALVFIPTQKDIKRLLAFSSVEHMGIIAFCIGTGGLGTFAGLLHAINHAFAKSLAFFSAGRLIQVYGTREIPLIHGAIRSDRIWGTGLFVAILALAGAAPFSLFVTEFSALRAGFASGMYISSLVVLVVLALLFIILLKNAMDMCLGQGSPERGLSRGRIPSSVILVASFLMLLGLGLHIPRPLHDLLVQAAAIVEARP